MRVLLIVIICLLSLLEIQAAEMVGLRPLQSGPIGFGPQFADIQGNEWETALGYISSAGSMSSETIEASSDTRDMNFQFGYGSQVSPFFTFLTWGSFSTHQFELNVDRGSSREISSEYARYQIWAGPTLHLEGIVLGGAVGIDGFGDEERTEKTTVGDNKFDMGATFMPLMRLYAGLELDLFAFSMGLKVFNQAKSSGMAQNSVGDDFDVEIQRKSPAELWIDGRFGPFPAGITLVASVTQVLADHAAEPINPYGTKDGSGSLPAQDFDVRDGNHFTLGLGGRLQAHDELGFLASIILKQAGYARAENVSLEAKNLGGQSIYVGIDARRQANRYFFNIGYTIPEAETYEESASSDVIKVEQDCWDLQAGFGAEL